MEEIKIARLRFPEIQIRPSDLHKARGYFGEQFREFDLLHNHDLRTGKSIYRYPAIQFKIADRALSIFSFGEKAIKVFKAIFFRSDRIEIGSKTIAVNEKQLKINEEPFGFRDEAHTYSFVSPWIGLNQKNYSDYLKLNSAKEKEDKLNAILINNIISFCKFAGYTIPDRILVRYLIIHTLYGIGFVWGIIKSLFKIKTKKEKFFYQLKWIKRIK